VTPKQVAVDDDEQPEPYNKCEYPKHIHQKIRIGVASFKVHGGSPNRSTDQISE
jgi:hypothetical protein